MSEPELTPEEAYLILRRMSRMPYTGATPRPFDQITEEPRARQVLLRCGFSPADGGATAAMFLREHVAPLLPGLDWEADAFSMTIEELLRNFEEAHGLGPFAVSDG